MNEQQAHHRARRKVEARLGFYVHLTAYVLVNGLLIAINLVTSSETLWFQWPLLGWGIGIAAHALAVFLPRGRRSFKERLIERATRKEMERRRTGAS